ncbi:MAG TPA: PA0069 family radical SAM protein [Candidatus Polarisedimenticolaceae bacterium]|nr:PA0069 family radical SAM protein [Candidatus Polarisedimenticolaceae bacterium]
MDPRIDRPRGRGATRNVRSRFERLGYEPFHDDGADPPADPRTTLIADRSRSIITRNDSPDIPFDRSINPYRGCEHGCSYCFARPTHAYLDMSPGLDFETKIVFKPNAPELLERELARRDYACLPLALGTNTDPYQPAERGLELTRRLLLVLERHRHPVTIVTKSALVTRDLDILAPMAERRLAAVYLSITTLDDQLARRMEPRAAAPARRLATLARLADHGVPTGVLASPIIPGLNDDELERILEAAAKHGASRAGYLLLRLPHEVREIFSDWLERAYPGRASKILARIREMRGGELNDPRYGERHVGRGPFAELLARRFELAVRRLGLADRRTELDTTQFRVPRGGGRQGALFD